MLTDCVCLLAGSPGGWGVADATRQRAETEALAAGLAAEQERVAALEHAVADMKLAWESERVAAASERAALEQLVVEQNRNLAADEQEEESLLRHEHRVAATAPQTIKPMPPKMSKRSGGSARTRSVATKKMKKTRPASAREARPPPAARGARKASGFVSARSRVAPHRVEDVSRSGAIVTSSLPSPHLFLPFHSPNPDHPHLNPTSSCHRRGESPTAGVDKGRRAGACRPT